MKVRYSSRVLNCGITTGPHSPLAAMSRSPVARVTPSRIPAKPRQQPRLLDLVPTRRVGLPPAQAPRDFSHCLGGALFTCASSPLSAHPSPSLPGRSSPSAAPLVVSQNFGLTRPPSPARLLTLAATSKKRRQQAGESVLRCIAEHPCKVYLRRAGRTPSRSSLVHPISRTSLFRLQRQFHPRGRHACPLCLNSRLISPIS